MPGQFLKDFLPSNIFSDSILSPKMGEKVLTSVNTFCCRTTSPIQSSEIPDYTVLKTHISRVEVLTSVNTFGCRTTLSMQCSEILGSTVLKTHISAFRKVLRHQNRSYSQRERSKTVRFDGFCSKSTPGLQIRLISMISRMGPRGGSSRR